jgi:SRSO17 transposase
VVADAGYGEITGVRLGLQSRRLEYVVAVQAATSAYPASAVPAVLPRAGTGRPSVPRYREPPSSLRALVLEAGRKACRNVTWRHGTKKTLGNRTAAM